MTRERLEVRVERMLDGGKTGIGRGVLVGGGLFRLGLLLKLICRLFIVRSKPTWSCRGFSASLGARRRLLEEGSMARRREAELSTETLGGVKCKDSDNRYELLEARKQLSQAIDEYKYFVVLI